MWLNFVLNSQVCHRDLHNLGEKTKQNTGQRCNDQLKPHQFIIIKWIVFTSYNVYRFRYSPTEKKQKEYMCWINNQRHTESVSIEGWVPESNTTWLVLNLQYPYSSRWRQTSINEIFMPTDCRMTTVFSAASLSNEVETCWHLACASSGNCDLFSSTADEQTILKRKLR